MDIGSPLRASTSDFEKLYAILAEASAWLRERGVNQWTAPYPRDRFAREIERGWVRYWAIAYEPVATVTVYETRPEYYPRGIWEDDTRAWYLCRFAVARSHARRGIGDQALAALDREAESEDVHCLRLDVTTSNPFLEHYYQARGFQTAHTAKLFDTSCKFLEKVNPRRG